MLGRGGKTERTPKRGGHDGRQLASSSQTPKGIFCSIKICEVCGAIQTINDTEKRIQMHLEGKIHQGFLRLRTEIETLKIRLEIIQSRLDKDKEKNKPAAIAAEPAH